MRRSHPSKVNRFGNRHYYKVKSIFNETGATISLASLASIKPKNIVVVLILFTKNSKPAVKHILRSRITYVRFTGTFRIIKLRFQTLVRKRKKKMNDNNYAHTTYRTRGY